MTEGERMDNHINWMRRTIEEAKSAGHDGEAPIAAIVVQSGQIVSVGRNTKTSQNCGHAHAELNAILGTTGKLGRHPEGAVLYSTLEPCAMCLSAAMFAGIRTVVYGAKDDEAGAVDMFRSNRKYSKWMPEIISAVLEDECEALKTMPTMKRRQLAPSVGRTTLIPPFLESTHKAVRDTLNRMPFVTKVDTFGSLHPSRQSNAVQ
jgi:tRNA(adenine34) deaminase